MVFLLCWCCVHLAQNVGVSIQPSTLTVTLSVALSKADWAALSSTLDESEKDALYRRPYPYSPLKN
tara:strand:- start:1804 stop:2001 length:198 start_codon:yes stop_codon:yes gene_type:complete